jgi:multidrug efflux pump
MSDLKNKVNQKMKEFKLSSLSVANRTTVLVLTVIILIAGLGAYSSMPRELFPELVFPEVYVGTPYPGNSPEDIEKLITKPLEKEINTITGIDKILSTSVQGYSSIDVKFNFEVDPSEALRKVKDAVDKVKSTPTFPNDLPTEPNVFEMNFSELMPVLNINLSGDFSNKILKDYAELAKDKLEGITEVSKVEIRGIAEKEMKIELDVHKMEMLNIGFRDVENAIAYENMTISGGDILVDGFRRTIRTVGDFTSADEIGDVIVKQEALDIVYLRDIAEIKFEEKEAESFAREKGAPVIMLDVFKRSGANLLSLSDNVLADLEKMEESKFPENLKVSVTGDQSKQTRVQVAELQNSIIFGILLVVGVLLFFLGLRNAIFVGIAIPLSMFMSFVILNAMGVTLNTMVLFSLVLALGMLVDNGIVIVENIYRLMDEGYSPREAAKIGAGEVAWPIIASTATTLGAFVPLAIWPGMMGEFMKFLPLTLMIVLGSSLFVALVINPVLTSMFMKIGEEQGVEKSKVWKQTLIFLVLGGVISLGVAAIGNIMIIVGLMIPFNAFVLLPWSRKFQDNFLPRLESKYEKFLANALKGNNPKKVIYGLIGLFIFSIMLMGAFTPKILFFPENEPKYLNIFIEKPIGTDIQESNITTEVIEEKVTNFFFKKDHMDELGNTIRYDHLVESIIAQVGNGTSDPAQGPSMGNTPHKARVQISFVEFQDRLGISTSDVMTEIRSLFDDIPGVQIVVAKDATGPPQGAPINIEIISDDYDLAMSQANDLTLFINKANIDGIEELKLDVELGKPEMLINIDRAKARRLNISTAQVGSSIRTALFGKEVSKFKAEDDDYPIYIRLKDEQRYDAEALMNSRITFRDQTNGRIRQVPISAVATATKSSTFSAVKRKNLDRLVTIQSNVLGDFNPTEVVNEIKAEMAGFEFHEDIEWKFTGQQEEQAKEMEFLGGALLAAVFLIFLIIVAQFNSVSGPVIILFAVVLSLIGVLLGLVVFQMDFIIIMTMIGIISLAGIVVNNAIVLIDYTKLLITRRKEELEINEDDKLPIEELYPIIVKGGKTRLRPVLLTAITTVLGLLPMAYGLNIDFIGLLESWDPNVYIGGDNVMFWGPMSKTIIFGLTFATFLTLVFVPVLFLQIEKLKFKLKAKNA